MRWIKRKPGRYIADGTKGIYTISSRPVRGHTRYFVKVNGITIAETSTLAFAANAADDYEGGK